MDNGLKNCDVMSSAEGFIFGTISAFWKCVSSERCFMVISLPAAFLLICAVHLAIACNTKGRAD